MGAGAGKFTGRILKNNYLSVLKYGAHGDGITNDTIAIQKCWEEAANKGKKAYLPEGKYLAAPIIGRDYALKIPNKPTTLYGEDRDAVTIIMPNQSSAKSVIYGDNIKLAGITDLTISTFPATDMTTVYPWFGNGISIVGSTSCFTKRVKLENLRAGLKLGSGKVSTGFIGEDIVTRNCITAAYLANVTGAKFTRPDWQVVDNDKFNNHCLYMEREVHGAKFIKGKFSGAGGYVVHMYLEGAYTSDDIEFSASDFESTEYTILIGNKFSKVRFVSGCKFKSQRSGGVFLFYGGNDVLVDTFTASSPYYLTTSEGTPSGVVFKNGEFSGVKLSPITYPGVTFDNVKVIK